MAQREMTQSALARRRASTGPPSRHCCETGSARLPNAQLAAECAAALGVSADWLLGLSDRPEPFAATCSPAR